MLVLIIISEGNFFYINKHKGNMNLRIVFVDFFLEKIFFFLIIGNCVLRLLRGIGTNQIKIKNRSPFCKIRHRRVCLRRTSGLFRRLFSAFYFSVCLCLSFPVLFGLAVVFGLDLCAP